MLDGEGREGNLERVGEGKVTVIKKHKTSQRGKMFKTKKRVKLAPAVCYPFTCSFPVFV